MLFSRAKSPRDRFQSLAESVYPSLYGTALRLTRDREEAEDLAQEAIVRAYEAFERFDGENFKAWILRILTNLYINKYRRRKRFGSPISLDDDENAYEPVGPAENLPDRQLFDEMVGAELEAALEKVPEIFRVAVLLSDLEGLSYDEVALATDVPVGTVRSRIARGRAILRRELERYALQEGYIKQESET
ncbi:MAG: sigma-70 family RNA polymerase sigma factor [Armatimonadetes bacterium]|nr:sigma-70 family RNA polymerase sigma factor [Armatimonadota bacterium]MBS1710203.1 sigma-70 family RNA polymerase sigma factor [Armatimonadota bacterium]MBX3110093.1 sigma-70 family RNA polymerase sigma factor [Fimbriimonadaceae bacterium]